MARALASLALFVGSLLLVGAIGELLARGFWSPPRPPPAPPIPAAWRELSQNHSVHAMRQPNQRFLVGGALFETNEFGFRGPSPERTPSERLRLVLIGDSFAMGWGVVYEDTYGALLESRSLETDAGPISLEVLNFALAGVNTAGAVERLDEEALGFRPDLIVYGATINDIEGDHYRSTFTDPRHSQTGSIVLWRIFGPRLTSLIEPFWPLRGSYLYDLDENYFRNPEAWADLELGLDRLRDITPANACTAVLLHTQLHALGSRHPYRRHYDALAAAAQQRGLPVIHSFPAFQDREAEALWASPTDAHPGPVAHRLLADSLRQGLAELPGECFQREATSG